MPTYAQVFPPRAASSDSREGTPLPSPALDPPHLPVPGSSSTVASVSQSLPASASSPTPVTAPVRDESQPPPYTQTPHGSSTPRARKPAPLVLSTPSISRRLSSQPVTPSPLGQHASTPLFLDDEKDDTDDFGPVNPHLLGPAGSTPPASPTMDPSTPRLPTNPVWRDAYGVGSSSPSYALGKLPDLTGVMSQRLSSPVPSRASSSEMASPTPTPSSAVPASAAVRAPIVQASAKNSVVTVRLHEAGHAHVAGDDVFIDHDGLSAQASGPGSRAVAVMPDARVAALAYVEKGVAYAKLARHGPPASGPSSSAPVLEHPPSSPPEAPQPGTRRITGRRTGSAKGAAAVPTTESSDEAAAASLAASFAPVSAEDVTAAGVVKARLTSTPLKSVFKAVISALPDYGRSMLNVVRIAVDLELADTATPGTITSSGRPLAIGQFKKNHYKFGANVFKTIDDKYPKQMWTWWSRVVAAQRPPVTIGRGSSAVTRPGPFQPGTDWTTLRVSGNCGLFDVVIGLLLWRMHIGSLVGTPSPMADMDAWAELVLDVEAVFLDIAPGAARVLSDADDVQPATTGKRKPRASGPSRKKVRRSSN
jgi:hypothetical protein